MIEKTRKKPNLKNKIDPEIEKTVVEFSIEYPAHGQNRVANELRKKGVFISPAGVRCVWIRHGIQNFKKRLAVIEEKSKQEGVILTEAQVVALEKKKQDDERRDEQTKGGGRWSVGL